MTPEELMLAKEIYIVGFISNVVGLIISVLLLSNHLDELVRLTNRKFNRFRVLIIFVPFALMTKLGYELYIWENSDTVEEFLIRTGKRKI